MKVPKIGLITCNSGASNSGHDFGYKKLGPFTTFEYSENDVKKISSNVIIIIKPYLNI